MVFHHSRFIILLIPIVTAINSTVKSFQSETSANSSVNVLPKTMLPVNNSVPDISLMAEGGTIVSKNLMLLKENNDTLLIKTSANSSGNVTSKTLLTVNKSVPDISLMTEGGTIVSEKAVSLKEKNNTLLLNMQADTLLENSSKSKGTSVARKGVHLEDAPVLEKHGNSTEVKLASKTSSPTAQNKIMVLNKLIKNITLKPITPDANPVHKPLVLSYEALKSIVPEGTSLPAKGVLNKQALNPSSHPGMVMPVVITVLVVPMFAVLGYLALKRGQEAWKNRHYKRMDFLLDGMYND